MSFTACACAAHDPGMSVFTVIEVVLWVAVLAASIVGAVTKDWRWLGATLFASGVAILLMVLHAWR